jgi:putative MFS transporter
LRDWCRGGTQYLQHRALSHGDAGRRVRLSNNLIGRISYVFSPLLVGVAAREAGFGNAVRPTAVMLVIALIMIFTLLPETRARELEDTARV